MLRRAIFAVLQPRSTNSDMWISVVALYIRAGFIHSVPFISTASPFLESKCHNEYFKTQRTPSVFFSVFDRSYWYPQLCSMHMCMFVRLSHGDS